MPISINVLQILRQITACNINLKLEIRIQRAGIFFTVYRQSDRIAFLDKWAFGFTSDGDIPLRLNRIEDIIRSHLINHDFAVAIDKGFVITIKRSAAILAKPFGGQVGTTARITGQAHGKDAIGHISRRQFDGYKFGITIIDLNSIACFGVGWDFDGHAHGLVQRCGGIRTVGIVHFPCVLLIGGSCQFIGSHHTVIIDIGDNGDCGRGNLSRYNF